MGHFVFFQSYSPIFLAWGFASAAILGVMFYLAKSVLDVCSFIDIDHE